MAYELTDRAQDADRTPRDSTPVEILHFRRGVADPVPQQRVLIEERPLVLDILGAEPVTIMRTPGNDVELVVGFLLSEGMISDLSQVLILEECPYDSDRFRARIASNGHKRIRRNLRVNSSCGSCGRSDLKELGNDLAHVPRGIEVSKDVLYQLPARMARRQRLFLKTGGSHAAALFEDDGNMPFVREDLGRHNALDKALGAAVLSRIPLDDKGVFLSGRASLEMVIKAARSRIGLVAAISAPSSRAVEAARRLGITLCGFTRGEEFAVYSHDQRIHAGSLGGMP